MILTACPPGPRSPATPAEPGTWTLRCRVCELQADQERVLGADHPNTLSTRTQVAYYTGRAGDLDAALQLYRELQADQERVLGADHPNTLSTRASITYNTEDSGDSSAALRLYRELLADQVRVLGADHPDTVLNRYRLGDVLQAQSQLEQAEAEYRVVPAPRPIGAEPTTPTLTVRYQVARCAGQAGNLDAALRLYRRSLPDQERLLGTDHFSTLSTRASIAYYTEDNGDSSAALLADQERVLGADHPDTVLNRYRLGDVLRAKVDWSRPKPSTAWCWPPRPIGSESTTPTP